MMRVHSMLRFCILELPLLTLLVALASTWFVQQCYHTYVVPIVQSYKRTTMINNFVDDYRHEFTYYNRLCGAQDISTTDSADLLIHEDMTATQAANIMLEHGAVAFRDVLSNDTATKLRAYVARKNVNTSVLGYNEVFWEGFGGTRVSLALGAGDAPIVQQALQEVGNHAVVQRTLEGILGPDPALVEISTLTARSGCENQELHSDSDWFGSSLLYSRTFLHSYSFFVALQDTPKSLGATTVCPGSHYCADIELEEVCENVAFEVSTNGQTGTHGLLRQGDAFMFNQNVWHRGPANQDTLNLDRVMFIMTFVSRTNLANGDRRRLGLGTYYYQRWNMWGHTFQDLKDAGTIMRQPLAALRALGIWKWPGKHWGIPWIHQLAQQMANGDDFYSPDELVEFHTKVLDWYKIPTWLRSAAPQWEDFIPETMQLWVGCLVKAYVGVATMVVLLGLLLLPSRQQQMGSCVVTATNTQYPFWRRLILLHACVGLAVYTAWMLIQWSELAQSVTTGEIFVRPFPTVNEAAGSSNPFYSTTMKGPTTLPERNDVLIGTRFDADFLASFNRFLDGHPGNKRWLSSLSAHHMHTAQDIVDELQYQTGARFLLQDYATGAWRIMTQEQAVEETRRAMVMHAQPLVGQLATHLKHQLADHRFGVARHTAWSRRWGPAIVEYWMAVLFQKPKQDTAKMTPKMATPLTASRFLRHSKRRLDPFHVSTRLQQLPSKTATLTASSVTNRIFNKDLDTFWAGERVWAYYKEEDSWYQADLVQLRRDEEGEEMWQVNYVSGGFDTKYLDGLRKYYLFQEGDLVEVDYFENAKEFFLGTITSVHPDGGCSILFDNGAFVEGVAREYILLTKEAQIAKLNQASVEALFDSSDAVGMRKNLSKKQAHLDLHKMDPTHHVQADFPDKDHLKTHCVPIFYENDTISVTGGGS